MLELERQVQTEVVELFALSEQAAQLEVQAGLVIPDEIALRQKRLAQLAEAKSVLETRAQARYQAEQAEYDAKVRAREDTPAGRSARPAGVPPSPRRLGRRITISTTSLTPSRGS